jgi:hypothetical protein
VLPCSNLPCKPLGIGDATKRKVFAYTVETGTEFQPPYSEALNIISEVSSGLVEFSVVVTREQSRVAEAPG